MATFYNQATLSYGGNVVNSNTTEAELLSGLTIDKTAISTNYTAGGNITYAITVSNMGGSAYSGLTVTDNLAVIDYAKCTGCGACAASCPTGCLKEVRFPNLPEA